MKFVESLTREDIESIAKGRVNRREGKKSTYVTVAVIAVLAAGLLLLRVTVGGAFALLVLGAGAFLWYSSGLSKRQGAYKQALVRQWEQEKETKVAAQ